MILKDSRPRIIENSINDNDGIGLFIRDKSHGEIKNNQVPSYTICRLNLMKLSWWLRGGMQHWSILHPTTK